MSVHPNYIKASDFIFITVGLGIINLTLIPGIFVAPKEIITVILILLFLSGISLAIRNGVAWIKYLFLVMMIFGLISIPFMIKNLGDNPAVGVINIIQTVFQFWALLLLFRVPKEKA